MQIETKLVAVKEFFGILMMVSRAEFKIYCTVQLQAFRCSGPPPQAFSLVVGKIALFLLLFYYYNRRRHRNRGTDFCRGRQLFHYGVATHRRRGHGDLLQ